MVATEDSAEDIPEVRIHMVGNVRKMVEDEMNCYWSGTEAAEAALDRFTTKIAIRTMEEAGAVEELLDRAEQYNAGKLHTSQRAAFRRVRTEVYEARAALLSHRTDALLAEDDDDDGDGEPKTEATTTEEAENLLASLEAGDRISVKGDVWEVIATSETDSGTPLVETKARGHYSPGTRTFKPASVGHNVIGTHGRGMGSFSASVEVVARSLDAHQPDTRPPEDWDREEPAGFDLREEVDHGDGLRTDGGVAADGGAETFTMAEPEAEPDLTFTVTDSWANRYGDKKAAVTTPAPWDAPDEVTPANEVVKSLEWEDHHYSFDSDREAWTLDLTGLRPLKEAAEEAGYGWETRLGDDAGDNLPGAFADLLERAQEGDRIAVTYAKKNGNGENTYEGEVKQVRSLPEADGMNTERGSRRYIAGLLFEDTGGKTKRVKADDDGTPALFSSGYYPFMGEVLSVEVW